METHLIIGIGGTGGRIIHSIRSVIGQNQGALAGPSVNIDYLYVDTSHTDLENALSWKEKTTSIALTPANIVEITKIPVDAILANIDAYPNIKPWIGSAADWEGSLKPGEIAAAQMRRYGRFLLAGDISKFVDSLNAIIRNLIDRTPDKIRNITFHICCGLAGGTGSGMLVDIITQVRKNYPFDESRHYNAIYLYTLLPELTPTSWATPGGLYHANGYACLKELNAMSILGYIPYDLTDQTRKGARVEVPKVFFNGCYVFTNENENDVQLNVEEEIPALVGNYIYKQIFSISNPKSRAWIYRLARCENGINDPEENPGHPGKPLRGKRFISFGIKRIGIPEVEIKTHLASKLSEQAILQLLYNRWYDGQGYLDDVKIKEFNSYVAAAEQQERWLITDEHNTLSSLYLPTDKEKTTWTSFAQTWERKRNEFANIVTSETIPRSEWIMELRKRYDLYYMETFRGEGVERFFQLREKDIKDTVRYVIEHFDGDLYAQWSNGKFGLTEIGFLLNAVINYLEMLIDSQVGLKVDRLQADEKTYKEKVLAEERVWDRIGFMENILWKERTRSFERQNSNLEILYRIRTELQGWEYAKKLLPEVKKGLHGLYGKIFGLQANLGILLKDARERIDKTCKDTVPRVSDHFVKFYDAMKVRDLTRELSLNVSIQNNQTAGLRATIDRTLDGVNTFSQLDRKMPMADLAEQLERHAAKTIATINDQLKDIVDGGKKVFNVSITEKLKERYDGHTEELQHFVRDLVSQAAVFAKYDAVQENLDAHSSRQREFMVVLPPDARPNGTDTKGFNYILADAFRTSRGAGIPDDNIIYTEPRDTEIVLINIHNLFPLRFLAAMQPLKTKYLNALGSTDSGTARRARITLHTEGGAESFPDLFVIEKKKEEYLSYIIVADSAGIIVRQPDPVTEELEYILQPEQILGDIVVLGKNLMDSCATLGYPDLDMLQQRVSALLSRDYKAISRQTGLIDQIMARLTEFLLSKGNNVRDAEFLKYKNACSEAVKLVGALTKK